MGYGLGVTLIEMVGGAVIVSLGRCLMDARIRRTCYFVAPLSAIQRIRLHFLHLVSVKEPLQRHSSASIEEVLT